MCGLSQFSKQHSHVVNVDGATGLRLRCFICSSQISAWSRNVMPWFERTTFSKYSTVSAPLASIISLALRFRSDAQSLPAPEVGQILSICRVKMLHSSLLAVVRILNQNLLDRSGWLMKDDSLTGNANDPMESTIHSRVVCGKEARTTSAA